jgi:2-dehydro-3-deoxyphosphogluconate aldolase/(4S)-4-hydroxy-2-oxoglutarate aldolase
VFVMNLRAEPEPPGRAVPAIVGSERPAIPGGILAGRVIAIGRGLPPEAILSIAANLADGGVRAFEITLNSPAAMEAIAALAARFAPEDLVIGAGTVLDVAKAEEAVAAGARFLVMPHTDEDLIAWAAQRGIPSFPGAFTPTEALGAWRAGAAAVKLFPASAVGPAFVREMRGPFRDIPLVPTGGVTVDSAPAFGAAGAVAVGIGSWLTGSGDADVVGARARQIVDALAAARGTS